MLQIPPLWTRDLFAVIRRVVSPIVGRPVGPHMLRHSFASRLRWNRAPLDTIQAAVGHANIGTTMMYVHLPTERQHAEIAKYLRRYRDPGLKARVIDSAR